MNFLRLSIILLFISVQVQAQEFTLPTKLISAYLDESKASELSSVDFILHTTIKDNGSGKFTLENNDTEKSFELAPLSYPDFKSKLNWAITQILNAQSIVSKNPENAVLEHHANQLFTSIMFFSRITNEKPQVATISLKEPPIAVYTKYKRVKEDKEKDREVKDTIASLQNFSADITFVEGFIEKIQVKGELTDNAKTKVIFANKFSIGISSAKNIKRLKDIPLSSIELYTKKEIYSLTDTTIERTTKAPLLQKTKSKNFYLRVKVGNVIQYVNKIDIHSHDISPASVKVELNHLNKSQKLFREESSKLIEAKVYSDLLGLMDEENPNGVVQIEVDKKFNLNTYRKVLCNTRAGRGWFQYISTRFRYAKLEADNKYFAPNENFGNDITNLPFYSPLSVLQNRNYVVGSNLNIYFIEHPDYKMNFNIDAGLLFGRTGLQQSIAGPNEFYANNIEIPLELGVHIVPEKRFKMSLINQTSYFKVLNNDVYLRSSNNNEIKFFDNFLNTFRLGIDFDLSDTGKLFFRYSFIHELTHLKNNFSQLQLGYSFYLLKRNSLPE